MLLTQQLAYQGLSFAVCAASAALVSVSARPRAESAPERSDWIAEIRAEVPDGGTAMAVAKAGWWLPRRDWS